MQWIRFIELIIGNKIYTSDELDMEFRVPFGDSEHPDISTITIWNLSNDSVENLKSGTPVMLSAGYKTNNSVGNLLVGKVESPGTTWHSVDKNTTFKVSDGGKEWRESNLIKTYQAGTRASLIMRDAINRMGLEAAEINPVNDIQYIRGKSVTGKAKDTLQQLIRDTNSKMRISKEKVYITSPDAAIGDVVVLNSDTGSVGTPERQEQTKDDKTIVTYNVTCLLNASINKGSLLQINSRSINGLFRVVDGEHDGSQFNTNCNVVPA